MNTALLTRGLSCLARRPGLSLELLLRHDPRRAGGLAVRRAPAQRPGEGIGDELVQADPLALRRPGELGVQGLGHPQQQPAAVRLGRFRLGNLLALAPGGFHPLGHGRGDTLERLVRRRPARIAARKHIDRRNPLGAVRLVADERHRVGDVARIGRGLRVRRRMRGLIFAHRILRAGSRFHETSDCRRDSKKRTSAAQSAPDTAAGSCPISARSFTSALRVSRETWICEIPTSRAT